MNSIPQLSASLMQVPQGEFELVQGAVDAKEGRRVHVLEVDRPRDARHAAIVEMPSVILPREPFRASSA